MASPAVAPVVHSDHRLIPLAPLPPHVEAGTGKIPVNGRIYALSALRSTKHPASYRLSSSILGVEDPRSVYVPTSLDYSPQIPSVRDQGERPICGAVTAVTVLEWKGYQETHKISEQLAPEAIYARRTDTSCDGVTIDELGEICIGYGTPTQKLYDSTLQRPDDDAAKLACDQDAATRRIHTVARIESVEMAKIALMQHGPCLASFPVYNSSPEFWHPRDPSEEMLGGHATTMVGWTSVGFIIRNSWGKGWGKKGYTIFPFEHWGLHWDVYSFLGGNKVSSSPMHASGKTSSSSRNAMEDAAKAASASLSALGASMKAATSSLATKARSAVTSIASPKKEAASASTPVASIISTTSSS